MADHRRPYQLPEDRLRIRDGRRRDARGARCENTRPARIAPEAEKGVGSGEWEVGIGKQVPCPHSPLPTPFLRSLSFKLKSYARRELERARPACAEHASGGLRRRAEAGA